MLACFSPPVILIENCAFVCTLNYYISKKFVCQVFFAAKSAKDKALAEITFHRLFPNMDHITHPFDTRINRKINEFSQQIKRDVLTKLRFLCFILTSLLYIFISDSKFCIIQGFLLLYY